MYKRTLFEADKAISLSFSLPPKLKSAIVQMTEANARTLELERCFSSFAHATFFSIGFRCTLIIN